MTERKDQRDLLNELLEAVTIGDGCASVLAGLLVIAVLVAGLGLLWSACAG